MLCVIPGQPIQVNVISFFNPDKAETSPPELILKSHPSSFGLIVTGKRLDTTMRRDISPDAEIGEVGSVLFAAIMGENPRRLFLVLTLENQV